MFFLIKLVVLDVDGTLTDGGIYYTSSGEEMKKFSVKDGMMIYSANKLGIKFAIITGRKSDIVLKRALELGITDIYQNAGKKQEILENLINQYEITLDEVAYIGDDLNDLSCMKIVGLPMTVQNGAEEVKKISKFISKNRGGDGGVRDCLEYMLKNDGLFDKILQNYL